MERLNRTQYDIFKTILMICKEENIKKYNIVYKTNVNGIFIKKYMETLLKHELIIKTNSASYKKTHRETYKTTEKGDQVIYLLTTLERMLK